MLGHVDIFLSQIKTLEEENQKQKKDTSAKKKVFVARMTTLEKKKEAAMKLKATSRPLFLQERFQKKKPRNGLIL